MELLFLSGLFAVLADLSCWRVLRFILPVVVRYEYNFLSSFHSDLIGLSELHNLSLLFLSLFLFSSRFCLYSASETSNKTKSIPIHSAGTFRCAARSAVLSRTSLAGSALVAR